MSKISEVSKTLYVPLVVEFMPQNIFLICFMMQKP